MQEQCSECKEIKECESLCGLPPICRDCFGKSFASIEKHTKQAKKTALDF